MTQPSELPSSQFTDEQVNAVLAQLEANPALIVELVNNAQAGNQVDLMFQFELASRGIMIGYDDPKGGWIHRSEQAQE